MRKLNQCLPDMKTDLTDGSHVTYLTSWGEYKGGILMSSRWISLYMGKLKTRQKNMDNFLIDQYFEGRVKGNAVKQVGNWVLVKQLQYRTWIVSIISLDNWEKMKENGKI